MKTTGSIVNTSHVTNYLNLRDEMLIKLFNLNQFILYSQDNVDFLTYLVENFIEGLDDFHRDHVFVCQRCGRQAVRYSPCQKELLENCKPPPNFEE